MKVRPTGAILAVSMLLEHALNRPDLARIVDSAVNVTLRDVRTPDVGGKATTGQGLVRFVRCEA